MVDLCNVLGCVSVSDVYVLCVMFFFDNVVMDGFVVCFCDFCVIGFWCFLVIVIVVVGLVLMVIDVRLGVCCIFIGVFVLYGFDVVII